MSPRRASGGSTGGLAALSRGWSDERGSIAMMFGLLIVPITLTVGGAVDFAHAVFVRSQLQGIVDAAALAGATAYVDATQSATGGTAATNYMNSGIGTLPANTGLTFTVAPAAAASGPAGYTVTVTAQTNVATSFLGLVMPSIPVSVAASALNPLVTITADTGNWSSSAWDLNTISWYRVPSDGSLPNPSALTTLFSNADAAGGPTTHSFTVTASQKIGFALTNVTGGRGGDYGSNQYGAPYQSTQVLYSQLQNPSDSINGYSATNNPANVNGVNGASPATATSAATGSSGNNCSLQTTVLSSSGTLPAPVSGSCFSTAQKYASTSCAQLAGRVVYYSWNDMGGNPDDLDYNDAQYTFTCGGGSGTGNGGPTSVVLLK